MSDLSRFASPWNEDPFKLHTCPYDSTHRIKACRYNQHIVKCVRNHGNHGLRTCTFNHSHWIPEREFKRHLVECPDRYMIQQDLDAAQRRTNHSLPPVNHHPVWNKPESTEDWDSEVSMEHDMITEAEQQKDVAVTNETMDDDHFEMKELLPEFPYNWERLTATQKKNYRRSYNKQRERMKERGLTASDFQRSKDPRDWTEEERQAKLDLMVSLYPPPKVGGTFIDYKSILNRYCLENKVNMPQYNEATGTFLGFAASVTVKGEKYDSRGSHSTKKSAAHSAAELAVLAMPITQEVQDNPTPKLRPARTANELQILRTRHEIGMLHNAGQLQPQSMPVQQSRNINDTRNANGDDSRPSNVAPTLMTPQAFAQPNNDIVRSMQGVSLQSQRNSDDEWKTAGTRKRVPRAGRGRGTTFSSLT